MSSTTTEWILELVDRISKPMRTVVSNSNRASRSIAGVDRMLVRVNNRSQAVSRSFKKMLIAGAAFGLLAAGSIQFEQGMARANTMANLGKKEFAGYTDKIREIAEVVPIAKKQLSEGLYNTISAGVPKNNWITFLKDSSKASIAGNAELGTVVDATASVIKAYGASWDTAISVQDRFQKTVQLGQIPSLESLATALPRVTAVASKLNVSQQELLGTFATASGVMGKPAEVATQLNAVLSAMLKPGAEATKMANKLGIAFDAKSITKAGGLKNYIDVLMPKIQAFSDRTGTTQEQIIGNLFGSQEAIKLVLGLSGDLAQSWGENTEKIGQSTGAIKSAFNIMTATTISKMQLMRNTFGNVMDGIIDVLAPFIIVVLEATSKVLSFISGFMQAHPTLSKFIIIGTAIVGTTIFLATAFALVSLRLDAMYLKLIRASLSTNIFTSSLAKAALMSWNFVRAGFRIVATLAGQALGYVAVGASMLGSFLVGLVTATAAQWGLNIALNANPIGLIVIGIAAAIGAIALMIKYWSQIKAAIWSFTKFMWKISPFRFLINIVEKIFPGFKAKVTAVFGYVKDLALKFWNKIKEIFAKIKSFFGFGDDGKAEVEINATVNKDGTVIPGLDPTVDLLNVNNGANLDLSGSGGGGATFGGGTKESKSISMTLNITQHFKVAADVKESLDNIANEVVAKINDRMRDAVIALD